MVKKKYVYNNNQDFLATKELRKNRNSFFYMVGMRGFEPPTTRSPSECATRLRYIPNSNNIEMYI